MSSQVITEWQKEKCIPPAMMTVLWEVLQGKRPEKEFAMPAQRRAALALLNMAACADGSLLHCKMNVIIKQLRAGAKDDMGLAQHACVALQRCAGSGSLSHKEAKAIMDALDEVLLCVPATGQASQWYATAEQAVTTLFAVSDAPEEWFTLLLRRMSEEVLPEGKSDDVCSEALSRFVFLLGHVAIKTLVHIEVRDTPLSRVRARVPMRLSGAVGCRLARSNSRVSSRPSLELRHRRRQELLPRAEWRRRPSPVSLALEPRRPRRIPNGVVHFQALHLVC